VSEKKGFGETFLGWFVERDEAAKASPKTNEEPEEPQEPREAAPPAPPVVELKGDVPLPATAAAPIDFGAVYRAAGIAEEARDRVEKSVTLLQTLPPDAPVAVKRQIVEASLKAFGYPVEQIVDAGAAQLRALQAFIEFSRRATQKVVVEGEVRIEELSQEIAARVEELNRQIAELKARSEEKQRAQEQLAARCDEQMNRVRQVLEFFQGSGAPAAPPGGGTPPGSSEQ